MVRKALIVCFTALVLFQGVRYLVSRPANNDVAGAFELAGVSIEPLWVNASLSSRYGIAKIELSAADFKKTIDHHQLKPLPYDLKPSQEGLFSIPSDTPFASSWRWEADELQRVFRDLSPEKIRSLDGFAAYGLFGGAMETGGLSRFSIANLFWDEESGTAYFVFCYAFG